MVKNNTLQFCCNNHIKCINRVSNMLANGKCTAVVVTTILYRTDIYITNKNTSNSWDTEEMQRSYTKCQNSYSREKEDTKQILEVIVDIRKALRRRVVEEGRHSSCAYWYHTFWKYFSCFNFILKYKFHVAR